MLKKIKEKLKPYKWLHYMLARELVIPDELWTSKLSFSQFGEDLIVYNLFKKLGIQTGKYIEIGAFDPLLFSNTYLFYRNGWRGILVEPNPVGYRKLVSRRPQDMVLNLAISNCASSVDFVLNEARSGISDSSYLFPKRENHGTIRVSTISLENLFSKYIDPSEKIHFLSVDCEGHDRVVLESNDWAKYRPSVVLVEDQRQQNQTSIGHYLKNCRYSFYSRTGLTAIFVENSFAEENKIETVDI
jgi:FkbM family methyltransferase